MWWRSALATFIKGVISQPVVRCKERMLTACPTDEFNRYADFPRLSLTDGDEAEQLPLPRVLALMARVQACDPPLAAVAEPWTRIAREWTANGVQVERVALARLGELAAAESDSWDALAVDDPREWLCEYINAVGEAWKLRGGVDIDALSGLVPDQTGKLHKPTELHRDVDIPDELKDIAAALGHPIRAQLLSRELVQAASDERWVHLQPALERAVTKTMNRGHVVDLCLKTLEIKLAPNRKKGVDERSLHDAALRMVRFLLGDPHALTLTQIGRIPALMRSGQCEGLKAARMVLPPVSCWPEAAQRFAAIWPEGRILDEQFADDNLLRELAAQSLVSIELLNLVRIADLATNRYEGMLVDTAHVAALAGVHIKNETFTTIALLQDIISRCNADAGCAKLFFEFIVQYVARVDQSWRRTREIQAQQQGTKMSLRIREALWLGDLRAQNWVPGSEQGSTSTRRANKDSLWSLLDPTWIKGNVEGIALLSECFGFDRLELELSGKASDAAERQAMREQLAQIVGAADGSPDIVRQTIAALAERKRQIEQGEVNRAYGLAVQEAVRSCLEAHGIVLDLVDHGFDYEVIDADIEAFGRHGFKVSGLLVEVKATTADEVSLTPLQAKTAGEQEDRFVLCVVPFKRIPELSDDRSPLIAHVREHARIAVSYTHLTLPTSDLV